MKNYQKDFSSWCGGCKLEKQRRQRDSINATKEVCISILQLKMMFLQAIVLALSHVFGNL